MTSTMNTAFTWVRRLLHPFAPSRKTISGSFGERLPLAQREAALPWMRGRAVTSECPKDHEPVDVSQLLSRWPHRCVFQGDGNQAWLVGLTAQSLPLEVTVEMSLTVAATFGEISVAADDACWHLQQGQTVVVPGARAIRISPRREADVLLLMTAE